MRKVKSLVNNQYFLLLLILFFGFFVRLYKVGNPIADWHSWRQADTSAVSRIYLGEGIDLLRPRYYDVSRIQTGAINLEGYRLVEFPIFNLIHTSAAKIVTYCPSVGVSQNPLLRRVYYYFFPVNVDIAPLGTPCFEIIGRLVTIVFSLISIALMFLIGRKLYGKKVGIMAAFLFAFIPYNIYFSRTVLPDPLGVTFGLLGIYFFIKFIQEEGRWFLYLSSMGFAGSLLIKPFNVFYLVPAVYITYNKFGSKLFSQAHVLIRHLIFTFLVIAPICIWRVWINKYPLGIPHFEWAFNGDGIRFQPAFWYWMFGERIGKLMLGVWGTVPFYLGLTRIRKNLFAHFWVLGIVLYVIVVATANVRHDYYQIMLVPPLALMVALGLSSARGKFEKLILTGCILVAFGVGGFQVKEYYNINHPELMVAGKAVQKYVPKQAMIIAPYNGDTAFLYQTGRYGWPVVDEDFSDMIKKGAGYFVAVNFSDPDIAYVEKHFRILEKTDQYIIADLLLPPK